MTHDEASCYVPAAIRASTILSHWGRTDLNHTSGTAYGGDHYGGNTEPPLADFSHPVYEPKGFHLKIAGHACYDPTKVRRGGAGRGGAAATAGFQGGGCAAAGRAAAGIDAT